MSEQINPGDKVMLVWACCAQARKHIGWIGTAIDILGSGWHAYCRYCGAIQTPPLVKIETKDAVPPSWLKKMPPDGEQIETREVEEIGAC